MRGTYNMWENKVHDQLNQLDQASHKWAVCIRDN